MASAVIAAFVPLLMSSCGGGGGSGGSGLPVNFSLAANAVSLTQIRLSWTSAPTVSDYRIYMNGTYTGATQGTAVTVSALTPATGYCFVVYAFAFPIGPVSSSNQACATTPPSVHPTVPTNLSVLAVSPGQISLSWSASVGDFSGYKVYRNAVLVSQAAGPSFLDTGLKAGTQYCYTVSAYDAWGYESPASSQACATTPPDTSAPSVPANLKAAFDPAAGANLTINLSWNPSTDDSGTVQGYKVYRDAMLISQTIIPSFPDTGLKAGTQYCYAVTAYDASMNESAQSTRACATTSWKLTTIDNSVAVEGTAIAIDQLSHVHMAYQNGAFTGANQQAGDVKYATNASGSWQTTAVDSVAPDVHSSIAITVGSDGSKHIAYYDFSSRRLTHAMNTSGAWVSEIVDSNAQNVTTVSIAHDSADHLHIVYNPNGAVTYATNAPGAWTIEVVGDQGVIAGYTCAIAIDASDKVHVAYYDHSVPGLKYVTNASGSWATETVDNQGDVGLFVGVAVDAAGKVHLSYYDATNGDLKYATNASGTWVVQTLDSQGDVGASAAIALDSSGGVHVSYTDSTNNALKYATNASGQWASYVIDGSASVGGIFPSLTGFTSIVVDGTGQVHISYAGDTYLRYATNR